MERHQRIANAAELLGRMMIAAQSHQQFGGDRDLFSTLGYNVDPTFDDYLGRYQRQDVAGAIVDMPANTTWRRDPMILEEDERLKTSPFTKAVEALAKRTRLWSKLKRADRLAGIKNYSVVMIGSTKARDVTKPLKDDGITGHADIGFFSAYRQDHATIDSIDTSEISPRYGLPEAYTLTTLDPKTAKRKKGAQEARSKLEGVHHTRIVHVAEDVLEEDIYGRPRLERVYNLLDDLLKITGSSAEMYWLQQGGAIHADIDKDITLVDDDLEELEEDIEAVTHKLLRFVLTRGVKLNYLKPDELPDPRGVFDVLKQLLAAASRIPQRILFGSERGELASTQDEANWFGSIAERQEQFVEPVILRPLIDTLIDVRAIPAPTSGGYRVEWPDLFALSDLQKAEVGVKMSEAAKYLTPLGGDPRETFASEEIRAVFGVEAVPNSVAPDDQNDASEEDALPDAAEELEEEVA